MQIAENEKWQHGDWEYTWNANGSLKSVKLPNGDLVQYEYDALGRRTKKIVNNKIIRYLWDNNVLLHEWEYNVEEKPKRIINKLGEVSFNKPEPINNLITWVYETGSFVPCAKIINNEVFSIINDYIGRPILAFDSKGEQIWSTDYDIYGNLRNLKGDRTFIPFRQLGQYGDIETGLYYNRFRYYDPNTGLYISKDPISILGGLNVYAYVKDVNSFVDIWGLDVYGLFTTVDGWYPVYTKGQPQEVSYVFMKKDELYKIGETQNPTKRYSKTALNEGRIKRSKSGAKSVAVDNNGKVILGQTAGLEMRPFSEGGTKKADRVLENQLLENYKKQNGGNLPAGNKTCH